LDFQWPHDIHMCSQLNIQSIHCSRTVYLSCISYASHNKQQLATYAVLTVWSLECRLNAYSEVRLARLYTTYLNFSLQRYLTN